METFGVWTGEVSLFDMIYAELLELMMSDYFFLARPCA